MGSERLANIFNRIVALTPAVTTFILCLKKNPLRIKLNNHSNQEANNERRDQGKFKKYQHLASFRVHDFIYYFF